jgi:hypothetical protein
MLSWVDVHGDMANEAQRLLERRNALKSAQGKMEEALNAEKRLVEEFGPDQRSTAEARASSRKQLAATMRALLDVVEASEAYMVAVRNMRAEVDGRGPVPVDIAPPVK